MATQSERDAAQQRRTAKEIYRMSGMFTRTRITDAERAAYAKAQQARAAVRRNR